MGATYTAIAQRHGDEWIGWVAEVPGVNSQGPRARNCWTTSATPWRRPAQRPPPAASSRRWNWRCEAPGPGRRCLLRQLLAPQDVVVVLRKPMGLVAHRLQQPQRRRVPAQP